MIVTELDDSILCEYQIKVVDTSEGEAIASQRNKYNHLLYEFERAASLQDLVNAIEFTTNGMRQKKQSSALLTLGQGLREEADRYIGTVDSIKECLGSLRASN